MKIDGPGSVRSTPVKRTDRTNKSKSGKFAKEVSGAAEGGEEPVSAAAPVQGVDALLAIQEVDDSTSEEANARARQWGNEILDRLEGIRLGLLAGGIPISELRNIARLVEQQLVDVKDPNLQEVLREIELRARVELAKYEREI